jgi:hypothetical protein
MTLRQLAEYLTGEGYPTSHSTLKKVTMPSRGDAGPPSEGFYGKVKLYDPDKGLAWARARLSATPTPFGVDRRHDELAPRLDAPRHDVIERDAAERAPEPRDATLLHATRRSATPKRPSAATPGQPTAERKD